MSDSVSMSQSSKINPRKSSDAGAPVDTVIAHKFGGTSVANAERYAQVIELIQARSEDVQIIVVSAMSGVTDGLNSPKWPQRVAIRIKPCGRT